MYGTRVAGDENLNETHENVFRHIEESAKGSESENSFAGLFDDFDVNSNKLGDTVVKCNEKLVKLLGHDAVRNGFYGQEINISVSTYVEVEDTREKIDIVQINVEIAQIVAREEVLRAQIDKIIAEIEVEA